MNIIGAGGHAKVVVDILIESEVEISGIWDENIRIDSLLGYKISGTIDELISSGAQDLIIAVGNNEIRKIIAHKIKTSFSTAIHPKSSISKFSKIEKGTVIMSNAVINTGVIIGKHVIINTGACIDHDCKLGDYVHVSPNASLAGNVFVGEGTHVGIGSVVLQGIKIGKWATIGAGAVVIKDVPDYAVVVGNPGNIIKFNKANER